MKKFIALLLAMIMVIGLVACGQTAADDEAPVGTDATTTPEVEVEADADAEAEVESDLAYVQDNGVLVVGITDFAPMDYKDENGEWTGFDAEMARIVADKLGVAIEFVEIDWDSKIMELDAKSIDVVWNGMTLTDAVRNGMGCTNAYFENAQVVVVPAK